MSQLKNLIVESALRESEELLKPLTDKDFIKILEKVAKKHQANATGKSSDYGTGTIKTHSSDAFEIVRNVPIREGMFTRNFVSFLKIGTAHGYEFRRAVINDVIKELKTKKHIKKDTKESDFFAATNLKTGERIFIQSTYGTAWGGIGYYIPA